MEKLNEVSLNEVSLNEVSLNEVSLIKTDAEDIYKNDNGLINTNNEKLKAYKKQKQHFRRIDQMEIRITQLEQELQLLKEKI